MSASFDRVGEIYDATRVLPRHAEQPIAATVACLAHAGPETRFLEPGVGTGRIALPIIRRGYRFTGIDVSNAMLDELRHKLRPEDKVELLNGDVTSLPFPDASFDAVICAHLLHLVRAWKRAIAEMMRVLTAEGVLLYCGERWDENSPRRMVAGEWERLVAEHGGSAAQPGARGEAIRAALRSTGADVETVTAATWRTPTTVGAVMTGYRDRAWSPTWDLSERVHRAAVTDLERSLLERYGSLEATMVDEVVFEVSAARWERP